MRLSFEILYLVFIIISGLWEENKKKNNEKMKLDLRKCKLNALLCFSLLSNS